MSCARQSLDYAASQEKVILTFNTSETVLAGQSNASYLSKSNARSRTGGHIFLSSHAQYPPTNSAILHVEQIIKNAMSWAVEAELGALYIVAKECVYIHLIREEIEHSQLATPFQTDNAIAKRVINNKIQPKKIKVMDMVSIGYEIMRHCSNSVSTGALGN